ncbi:MAG: MBL fold metallo-hydrolase [Dehalococcoidia bacterium]|nr:MBL fold metallo-hydrolase [Dehalococcoidia bacterium]
MKFGRMDIHVVSDGTWRLDGGSLFGQVPKTLWERMAKPDGKNRVRLGLNCLLIQSPEGNVLIETGVGKKIDERRKDNFAIDGGKLINNLRAVGLKANDIDHVVLTHLHFDHAGGCTKFNRRREPVPTFPRARYYVQQASWEDACHPTERGRASYEPADFRPLLDKGRLELLTKEKEIIPGVWAKPTGGHCNGHQMVLITGSSRKVAYLGDIMPTPYHVPLPYITAYDQHPEQTLDYKRAVLKEAAESQWLVVFSHGFDVHAGYIERQDGRYSIKPVNLAVSE